MLASFNDFFRYAAAESAIAAKYAEGQPP